MRPLYRRLVSVFVVVLILVGGYTLFRLIDSIQGGVPQEFSDARAQGGVISEKIVSDTNDVAAAIMRLSGTSTPTRADASSTIGEILDKVTETRALAIDLSSELGKMSQALPGIRVPDARDAAVESISQRLALVSDLISYTEEVTRLAAALRLHLEQGTSNRQAIAALIEQINSQITAINNLNRTANESMDRFDAALR